MKPIRELIACIWSIAAFLNLFVGEAQTVNAREVDEQIICPVVWEDQVFVSPTGKHIAVFHDSFKFPEDQARAIRAGLARAGKSETVPRKT